MAYSIISLAIIIAAHFMLKWYRKRHPRPTLDHEAQTPTQHKQATADCMSCSGGTAKCEQDCMMEASTKPVEYFDDEELDTFAGRQSDAYGPEEVEQFEYIMQTMRPDEVAAWCRSLTLRGIALPDELKDEAIMMIGDEHI